MTSGGEFCVQWNDFESNMRVAFRELREDKDLFDVTLACDDDQIKAHKVILSACSPFFRSILKRNPHEHPLLYLKGVKYIDLMAVLNFMYHGQVNVAQEQLNSFLAVAGDLQIKGLTDEQLGQQKNAVKKSRPRDPPERLESAIQPSNTTIQASYKGNDDNEIQEEVTVKSETASLPLEAGDDNEIEIQEVIPVKSDPLSFPLEPQHDQVHEDHQQGYADHNYDYETYDEGAEHSYNNPMSAANNYDDNKDYKKQLIYSKIKKLGLGTYQCTDCGLTKPSNGLTSLKNHVESKHLVGLMKYPCEKCGKVLSTANQFRVHKMTYHKDEERRSFLYN